MEIKFKSRNYLIPEIVLNKITNNCAKVIPKGSAESYHDHACSECKTVFKRFYANKTDFCCRCRQIQRRITHESCCEIKNDYPKTTALKTMEEVIYYFSKEKITCLLCGNDYSTLNQHLRALHEKSADDYKLMFGLPLSRGLTGTHTHQKCVDHGHDMVNRYGSFLHKGLVEGEKGDRGKSRGVGHSPALIQKSRETAKAMSSSEAHVSHRTNKIEATCSDCGDFAGQKTEMTVITKGCFLLCKTCKSKHHKESQENWARKKGINLKKHKSDNAKRHYLKQKAKNNGNSTATPEDCTVISPNTSSRIISTLEDSKEYVLEILNNLTSHHSLTDTMESRVKYYRNEISNIDALITELNGNSTARGEE